MKRLVTSLLLLVAAAPATADATVTTDQAGQYTIHPDLHFGVDAWIACRLRPSVEIESAAWGDVKSLYR